jgi:hypothetical protein
MLEREVLSDHPAHGRADDVRVIEAECLRFPAIV